MTKYLTNKTVLITAYLLLDLLAIGAGMGVPIFAILLGFGVGWVYPYLYTLSHPGTNPPLNQILLISFLTASFTLLIMAVIWLPTLRMLKLPEADLANFGIPLILYEPLPSFIGWIVLMVLISPFLQVLTTVFGAVLKLVWTTIRSKETLH